MNTGNKDETSAGNRRVCAWHKWGHSLSVIPGIPVAYILGSQSEGDLSFLLVLGWVVLVEGVALGVAYVRGWR